MIAGIGVDIIEVERIRSAMGRFGERFVRRVLTQAEWDYCQRHRDPAPSIAARFAAKEAASKAFGTGIGAALGWLDMEVQRQPSGQPHLVLHGKGLELYAARSGSTMHLSLSHTSQYAVAVAVLEATGP